MDSGLEVASEYLLSPEESSLIQEIIGDAEKRISIIIQLICRQQRLNGTYRLNAERTKLCSS